MRNRPFQRNFTSTRIADSARQMHSIYSASKKRLHLIYSVYYLVIHADKNAFALQATQNRRIRFTDRTIIYGKRLPSLFARLFPPDIQG